MDLNIFRFVLLSNPPSFSPLRYGKVASLASQKAV